MKWISLRNEWPTSPGKYRVKDITKKFACEAVINFDGWNFELWEPEVKPPKGSVFVKPYAITHWRQKDALD